MSIEPIICWLLMKVKQILASPQNQTRNSQHFHKTILLDPFRDSLILVGLIQSYYYKCSHA